MGQMLGLTKKAQLPTVPLTFVERPRLAVRLGRVFQTRVTTVIAGPGFGKSTALAHWARGRRVAWYGLDQFDDDPLRLVGGLAVAIEPHAGPPPPEIDGLVRGTVGPDLEHLDLTETLAARLGEWLERAVVSDLAIVLDDVQHLDPEGAAAGLLAALIRHVPGRVHLVLASHTDPPFAAARLRSEGMLLEVDVDLLALSPDETTALLTSVAGPSAVPLSPLVHQLTRGWPVAARLLAEALRDVPAVSVPDVFERLARPGGALFAYLVEEVLSRAPVPVRDLVRAVAPLELFTAELCEELGIAGAAALVDDLDHRGLFIERRTDGVTYRLTDVVRLGARAMFPLSGDDLATRLRTAGRWFMAHDLIAEALSAFVAAADRDEVAGVIERHGERLVAGGRASEVIAAAAAVPPPRRTRLIDLVEGHAREVQGDWDGAIECFERAGGAGPWDARLAWRVGLGQYLRGRSEEAMQAFGRAHREGGAPSDLALLDAWAATVHWRLGQVEAARAAVASALDQARVSADDRALAAAHTVAAMITMTDGDVEEAEEHTRRAVATAERGGDVLQIVRIRSNRASHRNGQGRHEEALADLDVALQMASLAGYSAFHALVLNNRGDANLGLGRLDQALADYEASLRIAERFGLRKSCYALTGTGDVHRLRGDLVLAHSAYERAVAIATEAGDVHGLVAALAGQARVVAADDLVEASRLADAAAEADEPAGSVLGRLAAGWVALARGDLERAEKGAATVASEARHRHQLAALAEALELEGRTASARSDGDPGAIVNLREAASLWNSIGNRVGVARTDLLLARSRGDRHGAAEAERRLAELGVRRGGGLAAGSLHGLTEAAAPISVRALGGFVVVRDGQAIPLAEWRSKKSRALLKLLIAREGRPVPRDVLVEELWPDETAEDLSPRLSVVLSTLRRVLDPSRRYPADHFVRTPEGTVALNLPHVEIDALDFLAAAERALSRARRQSPADAIPFLIDAEQLYAGEFLPEDLYADWAGPRREACRAAYVAVARELARHAERTGDRDSAVRYCLRLLEHDPYDEDAHLTLVRALVDAARHGEARRRYQRYAEQMAELGVEPSPFPNPGA